MEQQATFDQFNCNVWYTQGVNPEAATAQIDGYFCPSATKKTMKSLSTAAEETYGGQSLPTMHYYGVQGPKGTIRPTETPIR